MFYLGGWVPCIVMLFLHSDAEGGVCWWYVPLEVTLGLCYLFPTFWPDWCSVCWSLVPSLCVQWLVTWADCLWQCFVLFVPAWWLGVRVHDDGGRPPAGITLMPVQWCRADAADTILVLFDPVDDVTFVVMLHHWCWSTAAVISLQWPYCSIHWCDCCGDVLLHLSVLQVAFWFDSVVWLFYPILLLLFGEQVLAHRPCQVPPAWFPVPLPCLYITILFCYYLYRRFTHCWLPFCVVLIVVVLHTIPLLLFIAFVMMDSFVLDFRLIDYLRSCSVRCSICIAFVCSVRCSFDCSDSVRWFRCWCICCDWCSTALIPHFIPRYYCCNCPIPLMTVFCICSLDFHGDIVTVVVVTLVFWFLHCADYFLNYFVLLKSAMPTRDLPFPFATTVYDYPFATAVPHLPDGTTGTVAFVHFDPFILLRLTNYIRHALLPLRRDWWAFVPSYYCVGIQYGIPL